MYKKRHFVKTLVFAHRFTPAFRPIHFLNTVKKMVLISLYFQTVVKPGLTTKRNTYYCFAIRKCFLLHTDGSWAVTIGSGNTLNYINNKEHTLL